MMNQRHWESDEEEENKREIRPEDFLYTNKPILTMIRKKKKQTKGHQKRGKKLRLSKVALLLATAGQLEQKDILKSCITLPLIQ